MEVLILKTKEILEKDWKSLNEIVYTDDGNCLEELKNTDSHDVYLFLSNPSIVEEKTWRDVIIDTKPGDTFICARFRIEEVGIDRYVLKVNGKNVITMDFSDDVLRKNIEGILPAEYYTIGRMFFECIHWTRDFLEHEAKKCLSEVALDKKSINFLSGYYRYKNKNNNSYKKKIDALVNNIDEEVDWEIKYLLSQVQYVMGRYGRNEPLDYTKFDKWLEQNSYAKSIFEWGDRNKNIANVEFSNYNNFIETNRSYFPNLNIYNDLKQLKEQRNLVSHNIRNLVEQKGRDISEAIGHMENIANAFENDKLEKSLNKRKRKIEDEIEKINGIK